ncbi:hypothetical protein [Nitrosomonas mobilis]|nr:hypothetical protein [Nitrosomonas mobilis]
MIRVIIVLIVLLLLATFAYYWPRTILLTVYLLVSGALVARYSRDAFSESERASAWNTMLANFANAHLRADPTLTRLRRRFSAMLLILAEALLWPRQAIISLAGRPLLRRNSVGQLIPRRYRPTTLFYVFYLVSAALFALLPFTVLWFSVNERTAEPIALTLFCLLAVSLFARHFAMLIFPHDLKASMRRTPGDPRIFFAIYLCIDTFAFAVLVQFVGIQAGTSLLGLGGFKDALVNVLSISELRALIQELMQVFNIELSQIAVNMLQTLAQVTALQAFEMLCSGLVYLNIVRMLLPFNSWEQTDEDLKLIARRLLIGGCAEEARTTLAKIKNYDDETAQLDALLTAHRGNLNAAVKKMRWAHARNDLPEDADLIFMDVIGQLMLIPESNLSTAQMINFVLDNNVSDTTLVMFLSLSFSFGLVSGHIDPLETLEIIKSKERLGDYPLSAALIEIGEGDLASARARLEIYAPADVVSRCAMLLIKEIIAAPSPAPSINQAAEQVVVAIDAVVFEELTLAQQLTLVSILICFRCAIASRGETAPALTALTSKTLANIREFYPSHRNVSLLENYSRIVEAQARRKNSPTPTVLTA